MADWNKDNQKDLSVQLISYCFVPPLHNIKIDHHSKHSISRIAIDEGIQALQIAKIAKLTKCRHKTQCTVNLRPNVAVEDENQQCFVNSYEKSCSAFALSETYC